MIDDPARKPISDETLMRFADGELPPDAQDFVAAEIARDPGLAQRLEAFRFTREELRDAYASTLATPQALIERLRAIGLPPPPSATKPRLVAISLLRRPGLRREVMALAAAVALLLAGAAGWLLRDSLRPDYAWLDASPALQRALDATPSHKTAQLKDSLSVKMISTFASKEKRWCREFKVLDGDRDRASAVACRSDGVWEVKMKQDLAEAPAQDPAATTPAGPDQRGPVSDYVNRNFDADVSAKDELSLIEGHWSR
jgi:hypothetical protein